MMRIFIWIMLLCFIANAQKRFTSGHFVQKYNLELPKVTEKMLDVSELTHTSDSWEYFYQGKTEKLDSVVENMTIQGFPPSKKTMTYEHKGDTIIERLISIGVDNGDTLNNYKRIFTDNFLAKTSLDLKTNCIWKSRFDERGIKLLDVRKCPDEKEFGGQVFRLNKKHDYVEKHRERNGEIDSNSIRRYYLTPFDSIAADFMVKKGKEPFIVRLNVYNKDEKKQASYAFGIYSNLNEVLNFDYYTYTDKGQIHRSYHFEVEDRNAEEKEYELVNYTEYEYDKMGRKIRTTTRVKPDKKEQKEED